MCLQYKLQCAAGSSHHPGNADQHHGSCCIYSSDFVMQAQQKSTLSLRGKLQSLLGVKMPSPLAWALQPTLWLFQPLWGRAAWCSVTHSIMHPLSVAFVALAQKSRYTTHTCCQVIHAYSMLMLSSGIAPLTRVCFVC